MPLDLLRKLNRKQNSQESASGKTCRVSRWNFSSHVFSLQPENEKTSSSSNRSELSLFMRSELSTTRISIPEPSHVPEKLRRNIASTLTFVRCLLYLLPPLLSLYGHTRERGKKITFPVGNQPRNGSKQRFIPHVLSAGRWVVGWVDGFGAEMEIARDDIQ